MGEGFMDNPEQISMSADEFLVWIEAQDQRHELVDGVPVRLMAGVKQSHAVVCSNILVALASPARRNGCRATSKKTAVRTGPRGIRYPDVVVDCGPFSPSAREASRPVLVVEVSSPHTSNLDITDKLDEYRAHPDLRLILLVEPDIVAAKLYRRHPEGNWDVEGYDALDQSLDLPEIGASLSLRDVYDTLSPKLQPDPRVI
ncbi:MAG: Uma2 family endonuclease [Zymomonas sp.]|nr:MAG: Uma2 family endonuclease [Zymomonas sp.]